MDNAATSFPKPEEVYEAMDKANRELSVNAGRGSYKLAKKANGLIEETRDLLKKLVRAEANSDIIFCPSITIALNQIIRGINWNKGDIVYVSPYEHNAVARTLNDISYIKLVELPIDEETLEIDISKTKYMFAKEKPKALFCTHISNVTGYILPVVELFDIAKQYNAITVLDTAQSLGVIEVDLRKIKIDFLAFAGHKSLCGPFGIGGFINVTNYPLEIVLTGGTGSDSLNLGMPAEGSSKYEPSSFNIVAFAGLNAAIKCLKINEHYSQELELTRYAVEKMKALKKVKCFVPRDHHIGIVSFVIEGYKSDEIGMILDEDYDIAVRTGYHCAPFIHKYLKDSKYLGTVRVGFGRFTTKEEIDYLVNAIKELV